MGKPFKDKLKNVGDFISGTIAEVEKQGKDKLERGADRGGGRTVENKYNESEVAYNNMASGFFA
ncbi:hypothetical protein [Coprococcus comes]|uniref:hypothetical protein n=1 Tax=Coprococcus comes TaxID=410072 RepID=UPI0032191438